MAEVLKRRIQKIQKATGGSTDAMSVATTLAKEMDGWEAGNNCELQVRSDGAVLIKPVEVETTVKHISQEDSDE